MNIKHAFKPTCGPLEGRELLSSLAPSFTVKAINAFTAKIVWDQVPGATAYNVEQMEGQYAKGKVTYTLHTLVSFDPLTPYAIIPIFRPPVSEPIYDISYVNSKGATITETPKSIVLPAFPTCTITILNKDTISATWSRHPGATGYFVQGWDLDAGTTLPTMRTSSDDQDQPSSVI